jgi:hypothetical protein
MWVMVVLTTGWMVLGSWVALFPGTLDELFGRTYSMHDSYGVSRGRFEVFTLGTLAVIILFAVIGYLGGASARAETVELSLATDGPLEGFVPAS